MENATIPPKWTVKQQMYRALSAMRLELKPEIADDIEAKVLAHVDELDAEIRRLTFQRDVQRTINQALRELVPEGALAHFDGLLA